MRQDFLCKIDSLYFCSEERGGVAIESDKKAANLKRIGLERSSWERTFFSDDIMHGCVLFRGGLEVFRSVRKVRADLQQRVFLLFGFSASVIVRVKPVKHVVGRNKEIKCGVNVIGGVAEAFEVMSDLLQKIDRSLQRGKALERARCHLMTPNV